VPKVLKVRGLEIKKVAGGRRMKTGIKEVAVSSGS